SEVQDKSAGRGGRRLQVGVHQCLFSRSGDLTLDVNDTRGGVYPASDHHHVGLCHRFTPCLSVDFASRALRARRRYHGHHLLSEQAGYFPMKRCVNVAIKLASIRKPITASKTASTARTSLK